MKISNRRCGLHFVTLVALAIASGNAAIAADLRFAFDQARPGFTHVPADLPYETTRGLGFVRPVKAGSGDPVGVFAATLPEGNYSVTLQFGTPTMSTHTTVKSESGRLMIDKVVTEPGQFVSRTFTVNVRTPAISTGGITSLNGREKGPPPVPNWDDVLSLEFNGKAPGVASVEIKPASSATTVFLAGDSTVTDQPRPPYAGWGQMLPRFFESGIAVSNQAESGLALFSFEHQKRLEKILSMMKPGDYLFIQFGHNDQKDKRLGAGPFTTYKAELKRFVEATRAKGGIPVLVTSMERRRFDADGKQTATLAEYAEAVRQVGAEQDAPVIDLNAMSLKFYAALGPEKSTQAFVHYPANTFPSQGNVLKDDTHHNAYGAYELARCVVEGIKEKIPELAKHLAKDVERFDPAHPDTFESVQIPGSPVSGPAEKPAGS